MPNRVLKEACKVPKRFAEAIKGAVIRSDALLQSHFSACSDYSIVFPTL